MYFLNLDFSYNRRADFDLSEIDKYYSKTNRSIFLLYIDKNKILGTIALKLDKDTAELQGSMLPMNTVVKALVASCL